MNRRRIFETFQQNQSPESDDGTWMPLAEAAEIVRMAERDTDRDRMSRGLAGSQDSLLAFWAHRVSQMGVPIYGSRIMATKAEVIPAEWVQAGRIRDAATRLEVVQGEPLKDFGALRVRRHEFDAALARTGRNPMP